MTVFEQIDAVDWASLEHAYGEATDVSGLLRDLMSPDLGSDAADELYGNIWHQGTIYPATAEALPILLAMLEDSACPNKPLIQQLVVCIGAGSGYWEVHASLHRDPRRLRETLAEEGTTLEAELEKERRTVQTVGRLLAPHLRWIAGFMEHEEPDLRVFAARALTRHPGQADWTIPLLKKAIEAEPEEDNIEPMQEALDLLTRSS